MNTVVYYPHRSPSLKWMKLAALCWDKVYRFASNSFEDPDEVKTLDSALFLMFQRRPGKKANKYLIPHPYLNEDTDALHNPPCYNCICKIPGQLCLDNSEVIDHADINSNQLCRQ